MVYVFLAVESILSLKLKEVYQLNKPNETKDTISLPSGSKIPTAHWKSP